MRPVPAGNAADRRRMRTAAGPPWVRGAPGGGGEAGGEGGDEVAELVRSFDGER